MPEGHVLHREALDQARALGGHPLRAASPQGRFVEGAARLDGRRLEGVEAHGKHLLYRFEGLDGARLHVHLGLYGEFRHHAPCEEGPPPPRGAVRLRLEAPADARPDARFALDLVGPNACRLLDAASVASLRSRLGPDPLRADAEPEIVIRRIRASRAPVGLLLMDQSVVAGIGAIYRSELLFRAGLHPLTPGREVGEDALRALWDDAARLLRAGVRLRGIVTVEDRAGRLRRGTGRYGERLAIYDAVRCPRCGAGLRRFTMAGRRAVACETCQPPPTDGAMVGEAAPAGA